MNILFLGGSRYFGKSILYKILQKKSNLVLLVNRNSRKEKIKKKNLRHLCCDRKSLYMFKKEFKKINFDIVFDNIAYKVGDVKKLHHLLKGKIRHYIFTSSVMTYLDLNHLSEVKEKDWFKIKSTKGMLKNYEPREIRYALNKIKIEKYLLKNKSINSTILRVHNVLGKNDFSKKTKRLLSYPLFLSDFKKNNISGDDFIQFCFKEDLVKVIIKIFKKRVLKTSAYNIANKKIKIKDFYTRLYKIKKKLKIETRYINKKFPLPVNIFMNCSKVEKTFNMRFSSMDKILNLGI